jgi:hypothetical protein
MKNVIGSCLYGCALLLPVAPAMAQAESIALYNTVVDSLGDVLPDGTLGDPHYSLTVFAPETSSVIRVKTSASGYPVVPDGPWIADNALSAWIGPLNPDLPSEMLGGFGEYFYATTFDLTGLNPLTAEISGQWAADNLGVDILLNGNSTGNATPNDAYSNWTPFSITQGFLPGLNTLVFHVHNAGDSTGLRVEMSGTASLVPEPASWLLGTVGAGFVALFWRRRRPRSGGRR